MLEINFVSGSPQPTVFLFALVLKNFIGRWSALALAILKACLCISVYAFEASVGFTFVTSGLSSTQF